MLNEKSINKEELLSFCKSITDEYDYLSFISAVDYPDRIDVIYLFLSTKTPNQMKLKVTLPRDNPEIESLTSIWAGADWHERETYDLFGVKFVNHPNLERILTAEGFEGFPFRKDFKHPDLVRMPNE